MISEITLEVALVLLAVGMLLAAVRAYLGPKVTDRAVAADLIFFAIIGFIALIGLRTNIEALFDIILIATLLGFMAAISMARLGSGGRR
ncbi:monovalent cation/H+ antiporter complex subunit F [Nesterenkonia massiliensis]|uniref:Pesticidal protein Cry26Aa n=2 Tax=Nesterenkonia TaxID=57494 RepID=A0ABP9FVF0_9MICC|nr:monovalent cation/H+ antiporter complex subunit F [Nesterenkonia massiliensis]MCT1605811.1 monovalent cation/H+ antiporter complex subunit F [Nesterenkonia massiliensis]